MWFVFFISRKFFIGKGVPNDIFLLHKPNPRDNRDNKLFAKNPVLLCVLLKLFVLSHVRTRAHTERNNNNAISVCMRAQKIYFYDTVFHEKTIYAPPLMKRRVYIHEVSHRYLHNTVSPCVLHTFEYFFYNIEYIFF